MQIFSFFVQIIKNACKHFFAYNRRFKSIWLVDVMSKVVANFFHKT